MSIFNKVKRFFNKNPAVVRYELFRDVGSGIYAWNGKLFRSELLRSTSRPFASAVSKLQAKHLRITVKANEDGTTKTVIQENPDLYLKILLEEPNPLMCAQQFQEKISFQYFLNNNAFIYINRDSNGYAMELYPIDATSVNPVWDTQMNLFLRFYMANGKVCTYSYDDIIHLRKDFADNDIFGSDNARILQPLMDVVAATDQSVINAIKNSGIIKWLLKFNRNRTPEDLKSDSKAFANNFLNTTESGDGSVGVAATDANSEAKQIDPKDYVPNALIMKQNTERVYAYFNTNAKIVNSTWNEDEWNAYYEAVIEPFAIQLSQEFTRKIFNRRERGFGNKIVFDATNLACASITTKLAFVAMVDRGAMSPNEWRKIMNQSPIDGGDVYLRRKDTGTVKDGQGGGE